ncbi:MAG: HPr family phosphocarrier protein [Deltaproteobacteria bacterium]|nr:MAG: HPr family phosphocarrier protein [Deltaproteobacteria bacterium]
MDAARRELVIPNEKGLHVRAATALARTAGRFASQITVARGEERVDAKSIMGLLLLTASQGTTIVVEAKGGDATEAVMAIGELVESGFYE